MRWFGYEDEGLASVDVGRRGVHGEGLSVEFELETAADSDMGEVDWSELTPLFEVVRVHVNFRGLYLSLDKSKHWLFNKLLLQPLAGPIGRAVVEWVLKRQLRALLEYLGFLAAKTMQEAYEMADDAEKNVGWTDFGSALWRILMRSTEASESDTDANEESSLIESHTRIATKGIVRETATYSATDGSSSTANRALVDESTLAVGIGAQILPGKGGPHANEDTYGPRDLARESLDEVQSRLDEITQAGEQASRQGADLRRGMEQAERREQARENIERRGIGWRSRAFDL